MAEIFCSGGMKDKPVPTKCYVSKGINQWLVWEPGQELNILLLLGREGLEFQKNLKNIIMIPPRHLPHPKPQRKFFPLNTVLFVVDIHIL